MPAAPSHDGEAALAVQHARRGAALQSVRLRKAFDCARIVVLREADDASSDRRARHCRSAPRTVLPLGVNSNFRYWGDGITPYVDRAKGGHLWDVDGRRYIDYRLAFGPIILGHAFDEVDDARDRGTARGACSSP